jgi:hypothetical protein
MNPNLTVTCAFHITRRERGQKHLRDGKTPDQPRGKVPRIARLMALAIHCDELIQNGDLTDQSELARFGQVTTARTTQILSLLALAPDIQEAILFLPRTTRGRDAIKETDVRQIAAVLDWRKQRRLWANLRDERLPFPTSLK